MNVNGAMERKKARYHCMFEGASPILSCQVLGKDIAVSVPGTRVEIRTQGVQNSRHSTAIFCVKFRGTGGE